MVVTPPEWPLKLRGCYFYLLDFRFQIFSVLFTEHAAMNRDLGEKLQQLMKDGYSFPLWYVSSNIFYWHFWALWMANLPSCPQLAITLPTLTKYKPPWLYTA
jgi:hypothetical protein